MGRSVTTWKLVAHPQHPGPLSTHIEVMMEQSAPGVLEVCFTLSADLAGLRIPPRLASTRQDDLWKHTCFELFLLYPDGSYIEFNFSPSTQWAAYHFQSYRDAMSQLELSVPPDVGVDVTPTALQLRTLIDLSAALSRARIDTLSASMSAVTEDIEGGLTYWALSHPCDKPDFHHPDGFVAVLPVMSGE